MSEESCSESGSRISDSDIEEAIYSIASHYERETIRHDYRVCGQLPIDVLEEAQGLKDEKKEEDELLDQLSDSSSSASDVEEHFEMINEYLLTNHRLNEVNDLFMNISVGTKRKRHGEDEQTKSKSLKLEDERLKVTEKPDVEAELQSYELKDEEKQLEERRNIDFFEHCEELIENDSEMSEARFNLVSYLDKFKDREQNINYKDLLELRNKYIEENPDLADYDRDYQRILKINQEQRRTDLILNIEHYDEEFDKHYFNKGIKKLIKEIAQDYNPDIHFSENAVLALQTAAEDHLIKMFEDSQLLAIHAGREKIKVSDINLWKYFNRK